jgi:hypothetical protein
MMTPEKNAIKFAKSRELSVAGARREDQQLLVQDGPDT